MSNNSGYAYSSETYLESRVSQLEHLLSVAPITLYTRNPFNPFEITFVSNSVKELTGFDSQDFLDSPTLWFDNVHPDNQKQVMCNLHRVLLGEPIIHKYRFKTKSGQWCWLRERLKLVVDDLTGEALEIIGGLTNLSELIEAEEALRQSEKKHRFLLEQVNAGVIVHAPDTSIVNCNEQAAKLFGLRESELIGKLATHFQYQFMNEDGTLTAFDDFPINEVLQTRKAVKNRVLGIERKDIDDIVWVVVNAFAEFDDVKRIVAVNVTFIDITEHVKSQEKIHRLAHYDSLTQLPNRVLINDRIEQEIHLSYREGKHFALLFLDLDDFKIVNDSFGHHYGDALLRQVAARLEKTLRESDTAGRLGGDEFVVILNNTDTQGAKYVAQKIIQTLQEPFKIDEQMLAIQTSIGISIYPQNGHEGNVLTRHADIAMYHAKNAGRGQFCFFNYGMNTHLERRLVLERDLREALEKGQLLLYYQPQIDLETRKTIGIEALIRWLHPERGMISPADFIPIAEDCGLINQIGEWTLQQACEDIKTLDNLGFSDFKVAVNLSLRQLQTGNLFEKINQILQNSNVEGHRLELELTESVMMENHSATLDFMTQCKDLGIHFSIDDFGTGYSSLSYLTKLPLLDKLKIDGSFIQDISVSNDAKTIVSAIVSMAKSLRLNVVAEGVETVEQLNYLQECSCDSVQGFYFSRPVSYDALTQLLQKQKNYKY